MPQKQSLTFLSAFFFPFKVDLLGNVCTKCTLYCRSPDFCDVNLPLVVLLRFVAVKQILSPGSRMCIQNCCSGNGNNSGCFAAGYIGKLRLVGTACEVAYLEGTSVKHTMSRASMSDPTTFLPFCPAVLLWFSASNQSHFNEGHNPRCMTAGVAVCCNRQKTSKRFAAHRLSSMAV